MDEKKPSRYVLEGAAGDPGLRNAGERDRIRAIVRQEADMDDHVKALVNADTSREALIGKLANVLCNAMNFPPKVAPHILGQNMMPLMSLVADVVIARDRAVSEKAWNEGFRTCDAVWVETGDITTPDEYRTDPTNPYRITEENN